MDCSKSVIILTESVKPLTIWCQFIDGCSAAQRMNSVIFLTVERSASFAYREPAFPPATEGWTETGRIVHPCEGSPCRDHASSGCGTVRACRVNLMMGWVPLGLLIYIYLYPLSKPPPPPLRDNPQGRRKGSPASDKHHHHSKRKIHTHPHKCLLRRPRQ